MVLFLKKFPGFIVLLALVLLAMAGCADNPIADAPIKDPQNKVFHDEYDEVWRAIQLAMRKYPVRLNNIESGILETDYIKGDKLFADPVTARQKPGLRYKITIRAVKGREDSHSAVKVLVIKAAEIQPDFFTGFQPYPSYGLEESVILYRIRRYLELDRMLSKASGTQQN